MDESKLGKIVALAKHGVGGEKKAALSLVKRLCKKHNLDFDQVMSDDVEIKEYSYNFKTKEEQRIAGQVIFKILDIETIQQNAYNKALYYKATQQQHVEILSAIPIYLAAYKKEKKRIIRDLPGAFIIKHKLWNKTTTPKRGSMSTNDLKDMHRRIKLSENIEEEVQLRKQIEGGSENVR